MIGNASAAEVQVSALHPPNPPKFHTLPWAEPGMGRVMDIHQYPVLGPEKAGRMVNRTVRAKKRRWVACISPIEGLRVGILSLIPILKEWKGRGIHV